VVDMAPIKRPNVSQIYFSLMMIFVELISNKQTFFISSKQDGYPPHFFKRLDQFIHDHGFRARDIFVALDSDNDKYITFEEIVSGLDRIEFKISRKEEKYLKNWMEKIVGHDLNFKEFTLALKQRAPLTSNHRVSVWGSLNSATSSNNSSKSNNNSPTSSD
jgi:hypothetical protein